MFGPLAKRYEGIEIHDPPQDGDVQFVFHTYHGFIVVMMQTEHRISCSPDDARELLSRFHRFNLCWGLLGPGLVYVPFLTFGNYYTQRRSIAKQERALADSNP